MELNDLRPALGSVKKRKRIGRGVGSGHGKTSTKGHKGQKARSGGNVKPGFEGGQMPLQRRLPKRGFTPIDRKEYVIVNLSQFASFEAGTVVDTEALLAAGIISKVLDGVKVLGDGEVAAALTVRAAKFSASAREKITAAGGSAEEI